MHGDGLVVGANHAATCGAVAAARRSARARGSHSRPSLLRPHDGQGAGQLMVRWHLARHRLDHTLGHLLHARSLLLVGGRAAPHARLQHHTHNHQELLHLLWADDHLPPVIQVHHRAHARVRQLHQAVALDQGCLLDGPHHHGFALDVVDGDGLAQDELRHHQLVGDGLGEGGRQLAGRGEQVQALAAVLHKDARQPLSRHSVGGLRLDVLRPLAKQWRPVQVGQVVGQQVQLHGAQVAHHDAAQRALPRQALPACRHARHQGRGHVVDLGGATASPWLRRRWLLLRRLLLPAALPAGRCFKTSKACCVSCVACCSTASVTSPSGTLTSTTALASRRSCDTHRIPTPLSLHSGCLSTNVSSATATAIWWGLSGCSSTALATMASRSDRAAPICTEHPGQVAAQAATTDALTGLS
mmetsp:Transcript_1178/g.3332  ORF Transcript_1178/g.3332 Transcript_1178/m.3332 type:complete len:414 (-) Transcript_1178:1842-3083(-)